MKSMATWLKALLIGMLAIFASLAAMAVCATVQLHTAVLVLGWPIFLFVGLLSNGEPVTSGSPENPLPLIAGLSFGWLFYSSLAFFWLRHRAHGSRA